MFRFAYPNVLYIFIILPVLTAWFHYVQYQKKKLLTKFGDNHLISQLSPEVSTKKPIWKFYLFILAISAIILGLARPQFGSKLQEIKRKGAEIMIVLDVSNSMNATDIQPSRLERAKQVVSKLVDQLVDDKIGLIVFAGDAFIQIPITTDYVSAKMFLSQISTGMVPVQGTAIGKAIKMAVNCFPKTDLQKVIIVITDGENHEDDPIEAARLVNEKGIIVYTVGMGSPEGAPIPIGSPQAMNFMKDRNGNTVISKLDEQTLIKTAIIGGGEYISGNNAYVGIKKLFDKLKQINRKEYEAKIYADYDDQFQYFFAFALIILIIEFIITEKKSKFFMNFKLFDAPIFKVKPKI